MGCLVHTQEGDRLHTAAGFCDPAGDASWSGRPTDDLPTGENGGRMHLTQPVRAGHCDTLEHSRDSPDDAPVGEAPDSTADLLNPGTPEALPQLFVFRADDGVHGFEPWITDGTTAGTHLLADLDPGSRGSGAIYFHALGDGRVVFGASTAASGRALWVTDGTATGTRVLADVSPGHLSGGQRQRLCIAWPWHRRVLGLAPRHRYGTLGHRWHAGWHADACRHQPGHR
jgi:ELWxxDGT repeat protein